MAAFGSAARLSTTCFLLGLLVPFLLSLYSHGGLEVPSPLFEVVKRFTSRDSAAIVTEASASLVGQSKTVRMPKHQHIQFLGLNVVQEEAALLLETLRRDTGKWDANHPRRRLLEGLRGYQIYGDGRKTELGAWRTKYKKLPRSQQAVIIVCSTSLYMTD